MHRISVENTKDPIKWGHKLYLEIHWATFGPVFGVIMGWGGVILVSSGWRPGCCSTSYSAQGAHHRVISPECQERRGGAILVYPSGAYTYTHTRMRTHTTRDSKTQEYLGNAESGGWGT